MKNKKIITRSKSRENVISINGDNGGQSLNTTEGSSSQSDNILNQHSSLERDVIDSQPSISERSLKRSRKVLREKINVQGTRGQRNKENSHTNSTSVANSTISSSLPNDTPTPSQTDDLSQRTVISQDARLAIQPNASSGANNTSSQNSQLLQTNING